MCPHSTAVTAWLWPGAPSATATENQIFQRSSFHLNLSKIRLGIQVWEHSPLSCHKPTVNIIDTTTCAKFIYTPTKQRALCLPPSQVFDTSKFQQRKSRTADKPSRGWAGGRCSLVLRDLLPPNPTALSHPDCRKLLSASIDKLLSNCTSVPVCAHLSCLPDVSSWGRSLSSIWSMTPTQLEKENTLTAPSAMLGETHKLRLTTHHSPPLTHH